VVAVSAFWNTSVVLLIFLDFLELASPIKVTGIFFSAYSVSPLSHSLLFTCSRTSHSEPVIIGDGCEMKQPR
jgi:hypothetical protein